ncbi:Pentatricopeptide repeat-containing protein At5g66520 [Linum perenne]
MNTVAAATHPPPPSPYHHHLPPQSQPISIHTQKSILDLLNSKSTPSSLSQIHALILKTGHFHDHFVSGTLLKSYANHSLDYALQIFHHVPSPNVFVYNVLIKSCLDNSHPRKAISLYCQLTANGAKPNKFTYTPLLKACGDFSEGMQIHGHVVKLGLCGDWHIKSAGIRMYGRFGKVGEARKLLDDGGGFYKEGLEVFVRMQREGVELSKFALTSVLAACAHLGALDHGRWIHAYVKKKRKSSLVMDPTMATALLDMYAKCGRLDMAWEVFESLKEKEVFTWNAMIGGMAMHGRAEDAVELFIEMLRRKFRPNEITFVGVLNACAHSGDVDRAMQIFDSMERFHGIVPGVEHYGCLVHGLARAGRLEEAEELVDSMPMEPNAAVWGALLGGCRIHGNMEIGERAGKILLEMDPDNSGRYALLSNIYAKAERWDDVVNVRKLMKERGVKTIAGSSMIDLGGCVHEFKMGEGSHPQMKDIYSMLKAMIERLTIEGYVPDTSQVLFDIEEEEKETALQYHSEKLAIAFGFINTKPGTTIRVVKNLRVCDDCHSAIKLISRVYGRDIILRDRVRYHHFRNGACSCKDFW